MTDWSGLALDRSPLLVVGLRKGNTLSPYRVVLDQNVHKPMIDVMDETLAELGARTAVPYTPYIGLSRSEYLTLDTDSLTLSTPVTAPDGVVTEKEQTAALVDMVQRADTLKTIGAKDLLARVDEFAIQALCRHIKGSKDLVGFVTKATHRQVFKRSAIPLGRDNKEDRFKRLAAPEVVLEPDIHVVVAPDEVAVLNKNQFQFLVGDIGVVARYAPMQVKRISEKFHERGLPLTNATAEAMTGKAIESVAFAKRLDAFHNRLDAVDVKRVTGGAGFKAQDLRKADFVNKNGEIECTADRVVELVDALEGRFFGDAFSTEKRRADSFRKRA